LTANDKFLTLRDILLRVDDLPAATVVAHLLHGFAHAQERMTAAGQAAAAKRTRAWNCSPGVLVSSTTVTGCRGGRAGNDGSRWYGR
jgi:hypothetical protein